MTDASLWLDVDTGVDDALAIAYAIRAGAPLIGVSTVAGNVPLAVATENTRRVLAWMGAGDIPVHPGASRPLALSYHDAAHVHGENGLGGADLGERAAPLGETNGVQAILDAAERHSGRLTLVALGPLTNVAIALNLRPAIARQVSRLVIMSGAFRVPGNVTPHAEFNAFSDPHAVVQVLEADWAEIIAVGLDVTHQTVISRGQWERLAPTDAPGVELARQVVGRTFRERGMDGFYLHDPLAVAVALDPSLVTVETMAVDVALDDAARGRTAPAGSGSLRVATGVDAARFERAFAARLGLPERDEDLASLRSE